MGHGSRGAPFVAEAANQAAHWVTDVAAARRLRSSAAGSTGHAKACSDRASCQSPHPMRQPLNHSVMHLGERGNGFVPTRMRRDCATDASTPSRPSSPISGSGARPSGVRTTDSWTTSEQCVLHQCCVLGQLRSTPSHGQAPVIRDPARRLTRNRSRLAS